MTLANFTSTTGCGSVDEKNVGGDTAQTTPPGAYNQWTAEFTLCKCPNPPPPHSPVSAWSRKPEGRSPLLPMKTYHAGCIFKTHQSVPWRGREKRRPADFIVSGDIDPESYKKSPRSTDHAWVTVLWRPSTPEIDRATWPFLKFARAT